MIKKELGIFVLLVIMCLVSGILRPQFLQPYNLGNNAERIGMYGIFSLGLGMVIITGGIDLSVGSVFALLSVVMATMVTDWGWPWPVGVLLMLLLAVALGSLHGWLIAKVRLQAFIVTLCGLLIYRGLARVIAHDSTKNFTDASSGMLKTLVTARPFGVPASFITFMVLAAIMWVVLHRSAYGRYLFAVGRNEDAAKYSGINSRLIIGSAYALCGLLAGIACCFIAFYAASISPAQVGTAYELYGIAAAVLGGCSLRGGEGSIFGIVVGAAVIQVLQNMVILFGIPSEYNDAVIGAVIFAGVLVDQLLAQRKKKVVVIPTAAPAATAS